MLASYDFVSRETLAYFEKRLSQAPRDADFALDHVKREARRPEEQQAVARDALRFKCDMLWAQLDALEHAYATPGRIPPGAFHPERRAETVSQRAGRGPGRTGAGAAARGQAALRPGAQAWVLLAPERVLMPDPIAVEILKRCDGKDASPRSSTIWPRPSPPSAARSRPTSGVPAGPGRQGHAGARPAPESAGAGLAGGRRRALVAPRAGAGGPGGALRAATMNRPNSMKSGWRGEELRQASPIVRTGAGAWNGTTRSREWAPASTGSARSGRIVLP